MSSARSASSSSPPSAPTTVDLPAGWVRDPVRRADWLERILVECFAMDVEDARMICGVVVDQFGAKDEVLDDELPSDIRSIFYTLEAKRILTFRRIEYKGDEGETRRGFFWRFNTTRNGAPQVSVPGEAIGEEDVYANLPKDCWSRSQ